MTLRIFVVLAFGILASAQDSSDEYILAELYRASSFNSASGDESISAEFQLGSDPAITQSSAESVPVINGTSIFEEDPEEGSGDVDTSVVASFNVSNTQPELASSSDSAPVRDDDTGAWTTRAEMPSDDEDEDLDFSGDRPVITEEGLIPTTDDSKEGQSGTGTEKGTDTDITFVEESGSGEIIEKTTKSKTFTMATSPSTTPSPSPSGNEIETEDAKKTSRASWSSTPASTTETASVSTQSPVVSQTQNNSIADPVIAEEINEGEKSELKEEKQMKRIEPPVRMSTSVLAGIVLGIIFSLVLVAAVVLFVLKLRGHFYERHYTTTRDVV